MSAFCSQLVGRVALRVIRDHIGEMQRPSRCLMLSCNVIIPLRELDHMLNHRQDGDQKIHVRFTCSKQEFSNQETETLHPGQDTFVTMVLW